MLLEIWLALFFAGVLTSIAAFYTKTAALYASILNFFLWGIIALGALELTIISNGTEMTVEAPAVVFLALVNALVSLPVAFAAAAGKWGKSKTDDGLGSATGRMDPDVAHPGLRNRGGNS